MESSSLKSSRFTLRNLIALIAIMGLVLVVSVPLVRKQRELARQIQCINNLKQIGLAVRNFHDVRKEIIPSYLTDDHSSAAVPRNYPAWPVLIFPFLESENRFFPLIELGTPLNAEPQDRTLNGNHAVVRAARVPSYFCPSRRFPMLTRDGACATGDYTCVSKTNLSPTVVPAEPRTWDAAMLVCRAFNASTASNTAILGDFEPGSLRAREFRSMTTFADITDGLSNTIFIGEKAIHADRLGGDPLGPTKTQLASQQDGTFYYGSGGNLANLKAPGAIAYWSRRLAPVDSQESLLPDQPRSEDPNNRFGGWHDGLTLFLMGDGSVRGIDHQVDNLVLQRLGCRNDGDKRPLPPDAAAEH